MSTSNTNTTKPRVQKICTLWTHDDNFSRDDIVFNGEKFPELPTTPGTLLQIVAVDSGTAVRDFQSNASNTQHHSSQARSRDATHDSGVKHTPQRFRRESMTVTINENGSKVPGGRDMDEEKAFVFSVAALPADLKSKHANLQVSIAERIARVFGFRNRMQVIVAEADEEKHEAHHVELVFRDEYLARADMWRLAIAELSQRTVYKNQKLLFMGTIKATIKHIYIHGHSVHSGYFSARTKPVFRSESARYVLFIQMSKEMWDFDATGAGEIMFNKVVGGFLPDLFNRWLKNNAKHLVTIILFTRMQYKGELTSEQPQHTTWKSEAESRPEDFRDYYRVVVSDMASIDWVKILYQLKKEFRTFLREVSIVPKPANTGPRMEKSEAEPELSDTILAGKPSSASQGNILEAINLAAAQFSKDYIDRDLVRTGISVIVVTPGTGVFEVDYNLLKLTTDTLMGSGIGIDLVCLAPMPLHSVPLFKYRTPRSQSAVESLAAHQDNSTIPSYQGADLEDKTPRQYDSFLGSLGRTIPADIFQLAQSDRIPSAAEVRDGWRFAMPYWVDVSFWSGTSDDMLELTKPRRPDRIVKRSRKKGRMFSLRCRLYELQMMGVMENELGDISIPYLEEDQLPLRHASRQIDVRGSNKSFGSHSALLSSTNASGSYSSRGDRDVLDDQLDADSIAQKAWMEAYDEGVFTSLVQTPIAATSRTSAEPKPYGSPELLKAPQMSTSYRGAVSSSLGKTARPPHDVNFHELMRERSRDETGQSPRSRIYQISDQRSAAGMPRADVLQRQRALGRANAVPGRPSTHRRIGSGESQSRSKSIVTTPRQSPAPSRGHSPPRSIHSTPSGPQSTPKTSVPVGVNADAKSRPGNWFLRQISFGGKAAPAKPTIAGATIDISQGNVKPAMLTVEKNQKGAIAERLASTRLTSVEKPSEPIAIRAASRSEVSSDLPPSHQPISSVETAGQPRSSRQTVSSQANSVIRDPGSTFLLAGSRVLGESVPPKQIISSSGGVRDMPQTLSPTSAIAPWAVLVNPCNPRRNSINPRNQYRRWHHVFPRTLRASTVKWRSLCSPAAVPLTHEWFPTAEQIATEYNESPYKITQNEDDEMLESSKSRESLVRELIAFRLSHGFQIIVGASVAEFSGRQEKALASILAPDYMSVDGDTIFMSVGNSIHQLVCVAGGEVEVKRYNRKPTTALESSAGVDAPFPYRAYIRTAFEDLYNPRDVVLRPPRKEYNWNLIDTFLAGYHDELSDVLRFWRARFVLIPVDIPVVNRRPLAMLPEDSPEEIRLEGIRKLTQLWQRNRHVPPDERNFQTAVSKKQKDPNPLAIAYHTRDPSAILAAGPEAALFSESESGLQNTLFSESEKYHSAQIDLKRLAEDLQGEGGIQMLDRRWHWKLHYTCFLGFDLVNWLLANFKDIETRDEAVEVGNELMNKGLFIHVQRRHQFRDGNFFFQIAPEYRAPRADTRTGWFGMRKSDKSVPSTPLADGPRTSPLASKITRARPSTSDSSSTSDSGPEGEKTPTRMGSPKRKVTMSRVMRYDVDSRKRSYRPEIISLHYDRLHNPDNCYHIRIDWMNVTAKLIEDAIVTWATSVEKYGLKLVEVPIAEVADIVDYHPFRCPYAVELALQPPQAAPEALWDSTHFSPQYSKADKFAYHKALLRKLNFVLDMEAASAFPPDIEVSYSWGTPDYKNTQFIHRSGTLLAQITDDGNFRLLANRLAHSRVKDNRYRPTDPYEHKKAIMDGSQSSRLPSTPAERANPHRSPFSSPVTRPIQDSSMLHTALQDRFQSTATQLASAAAQTAEQVKDEVEAFCSDAHALSAFYNEAFRQAPSPSPRILPVLDDKIPSLGLPPAISIREASPANSGWTLSSTFLGRGTDTHIGTGSGIAGRRQGSELNIASLAKRSGVGDVGDESGPKRQDSQGSLNEERRKT